MMLFAHSSPAAAPEARKVEAPKPAPSSSDFGGIPTPPVVNDALKEVQSEGFKGSIIVIELFLIVILGGAIWRRQVVTDRALTARDNIHRKALEARDTVHAKALADRDLLIEKARDEWDTQLAALHESRVSLLREVMAALSNASAVMSVHQMSAAERVVSIEKLNDLLRDLVSTSAASRQQFLGIAQNIETQGRINAESLARMSWQPQPAGKTINHHPGGPSI